MTKFSVIIPLYNKEAYIRRAIVSALQQDFLPHEIIIIDDSSTDESGEIAQSYQSNPLFRIMSRSEPGPGGYAARNLGIREARGEWIALLDADDEWKPNHLSNARDIIEERGFEVRSLFSGAEKKSNKDGHITEDIFTANNQGNERIFSFEQFLDVWIGYGYCPCYTSASIIRRDVFIEAGLFPDMRCVRGGDKDLWLRVGHFGKIAFTGSSTAIFYRHVAQQVTSKRPQAFRHCVLDTIEKMMLSCTIEVEDKLKAVANIETYLYAASIYGARRSWLRLPDYFRPNELSYFYLVKTPGLVFRCLVFRLMSLWKLWWRAARAAADKKLRASLS